MTIIDISNLLAIATILIPFIVSALIIVCPQPAAKGLSIFAAALATALSIAAWAGLAVSGEQQLSLTIAALGQAEILGLVLDKTSVMLATCFVSIGLLIAIYSVGYLNAGNREHPDAPRRRFAFFIFGSELAFEGGLMHMFNHAFAKTLFFLVAGAFSYVMGTRMLPQIKGVLKKQPLLAVAFTIAALAIAGVPPFNGFFSKFAIFSGSFAVADSWPLLLILVIALVETVGCFAWFLKWIGSVVLGEPSEVVASSQPLPKAMTAVFVILIVMTVLSSFIAASWLG